MKPIQPWIPIAKIQSLVTLEPVMIVLGLFALAWLIYRVLLRGVSPERHKNLRSNFKNLFLHTLGGLSVFALYYTLNNFAPPSPALLHVNSYIGFLALLWGIVVFIKTARVLVFEYLFLGHMHVAVPLLLVNIFTLILTLVMSGWIATEIFSVRLTPLLATSAILSLVLGLALQDTLGNLFAGIALQFDKPYEIDDWIEVQNGSQKWVGRVYEISWRATVLTGFGEEVITISNRTMAQSEIANFSAKTRPFFRLLDFKLPYGTPIPKIKEIISFAALATPGVRKEPLPFVNVRELNESWILFKLIYCIDSYPQQYIIADRILIAALNGIEAAGFKVATSKLEVTASNIAARNG